jgi:uncharacterized protein YpmS
MKEKLSVLKPMHTFIWILAIVLVLVIIVALFGGCVRCKPSADSTKIERMSNKKEKLSSNTSSIKAVVPSIQEDTHDVVSVSSSGNQTFRSDIEPTDFDVAGNNLLISSAASPY